MNYAKNIQKSGFSDYPNLQKDVKEICQNIIDALQHERKGNSTTAERHIMKAIKICGEHPLAISIIDRSYAFRGSSILNDLKSNNFNYTEQANYPLSFFRCRSLEGATHSLTSFRDMLHIPLNKRSLCSEQKIQYFWCFMFVLRCHKLCVLERIRGADRILSFSISLKG